MAFECEELKVTVIIVPFLLSQLLFAPLSPTWLTAFELGRSWIVIISQFSAALFTVAFKHS